MHIYKQTDTHTYAHKYIKTHKLTDIHRFTQAHIHKNIYTHVQINVNVLYTYKHRNSHKLYTCMCKYMRIYTYMYM